jgi:hypothetical protein
MVPMWYGLYKTIKTDYREERRQMQETLAYDREMKLKQMKEIIAGPPRRVTATPAGRTEPKPNGRQ